MSFWESCKKAFKVNVEEDYTFSDEEVTLLENLARAIKKRGLTTPAILFLESFKPMSFVGSQVMVFFRPIVSAITDTTTYEKYTEILSRRGSIDRFLEIIEKQESEPGTQKPKTKRNSES